MPNNISQFQIDQKIVNFIYDIPGISKGYIVGGALRDIILKKKVNDYDLIISSDDYLKVIETFKIKGAVVFCLDEERDYYRIITAIDEKNQVQLDLIKLESYDLKKDLSNRDFTINAIALPIKYFITGKVSKNDLIDPYNGVEDIMQKKLRPVNKKTIFVDDPVRIIRGFRFISWGFKPEKNLFNSIQREKNRLKNVSPERIYQELFPLLEEDELKEDKYSDFLILFEMTRLNLWNIIFSFQQDLFSMVFSTLDSNKELFIKMEEWFNYVREYLKDYLTKNDITFLKWLTWWSMALLDYRQTQKGEVLIRKFVNDFNDYFPVSKKHKKCSEFFIKGFFFELKANKGENHKGENKQTKEDQKEMASFFVDKSQNMLEPDILAKEKFLITGQILADRLKLEKQIKTKKQVEHQKEDMVQQKANLLSVEFDWRQKNLEQLKDKLSLIKNEIDGRFVLSYFEKPPGPWLSQFLSKVYYNLLIQLIEKPPDKELKELGEQTIKELKESEGFGGEYDS